MWILLTHALLSAHVAADITTSFALPYATILGTDQITYVASVINADKDTTTLVAGLMEGPDYEAIGMAFPGGNVTWTLASTLFEQSTDREPAGRTTEPGAWSVHVRCEMQTSDASATCTESIGANVARFGRCNEPVPGNTGSVLTRVWTPNPSNTEDVETVVQTYPGRPTTPPPDWCSGVSDDQGPVPSSALRKETLIDRDEIPTFTFIITAGEEKLPEPTAGGTPSTEHTAATTTETGESEGSESTATTTEESGVAMPAKTLAPVLAGLGAAVAAFL